MRDEALDVLERGLLVEREAEVGELQGDVRAQLLGREPVEDLHVRRDGGLGALGRRDLLAEQGRVRVQPGLVQAAEDGDALVERLARDEPRRAEPHPVAVDDLAQAPAVGRAEDELPRQRAENAQLSDGSAGMSASTPYGPPLRRRTSLQSSSGSCVKTSVAIAGSRIHEPSSSSTSSWPGPQPA